MKAGGGVFCEPVFIRGSGLGNRLFPWARCKIFSVMSNVPMLSPSWAHLRTGPLRKGGVDVQTYCRKILLWDTFVRSVDEIAGLRKLMVRAIAKKICEPEEMEYLATNKIFYESASEPKKIKLIFFKGESEQFQKLYPWRNFLLEQLRAITSPKWIRFAGRYQDVPIAINVRRGKDFPDDNALGLRQTGPVRTPLRWFVETLRVIRQTLGYTAKAYVVSDGSASDLREILTLENIELVQSPSPLSDLLVLTKAKILVGSGSSSFSAWAAFFGGMPTVTYPGHSLTWFRLKSDDKQYVGDFNPNEPPTIFKNQIRKQLPLKKT